MDGRLAAETRRLMAELGVAPGLFDRGTLAVTSPIDGATIASVAPASAAEAAEAIGAAHDAFGRGRRVPAPRRGERRLIRPA